MNFWHIINKAKLRLRIWREYCTEISEIHSHNFLTKFHEKKMFFTTYIIYKIVDFTKYLFSENTFLVFPLCAEVKSTQCKNFKIFLSFRFCVKSILQNLEVLKMPFLPHQELCVLLLWSISAFKKCKIA